MYVRKIVSGGQTGADRAALDAAIELGIPHGGWVPLGRMAEDGPLAARYHVQETKSRNPAVRTRRNVRDSDATLIFSRRRLTGGSALTLRLARRHDKPMLHIALRPRKESVAVKRIRGWLDEIQPAVLNVAGPRASSDPQIYEMVKKLLRGVFQGKA